MRIEYQYEELLITNYFEKLICVNYIVSVVLYKSQQKPNNLNNLNNSELPGLNKFSKTIIITIMASDLFFIAYIIIIIILILSNKC